MGCLPETNDVRLLELQGEAWLSQGDQYAGRLMLDFAGQLFSNGNAGGLLLKVVDGEKEAA